MPCPKLSVSQKAAKCDYSIQEQHIQSEGKPDHGLGRALFKTAIEYLRIVLSLSAPRSSLYFSSVRSARSHRQDQGLDARPKLLIRFFLKSLQYFQDQRVGKHQ